MLGLLKRLSVRHEQKAQDILAIAKAQHEAERAADETEKTMADTVCETYDKLPDGGPV